ncbi:hypothetical protein G6F42_015258 [Rhizopus arrhizus]|nr:hypothetical protein G6F42_015258 [Rhizopus arrhizus]
MERNLTPSKAIPSSNKLAALIELSKYRLPTIATTIVTVIENVSKSPLSRNDDIVPKDVLQSQLFLLRMLSACMHHHWKYCQDLDKKSHKKQRQDGTESPTRPSLNRVDGTTPQHSMWSPPEGMPPVLIDPPPLEDNLAKHIVHVMSRFIYQIGILDEKEHDLHQF